MRWKLALVPLLVGIATVSCSFFPERTKALTLDLNREAFSKFLADQRSTYDCYFVSVSGPGISPDFGPLNLGSRSPSCLGLGMTSNLVDLNTLTSRGTKIRVTAGANRFIRILGVNSNFNGGQCAGFPLGSIFGTFRPAVFELASATEDIFVDKKVAVTGNPDLAGTADIVAACDNTGDEDDPPSNDFLESTGSYLVTMVSSGANQHRLKLFPIDDINQTLGTPTLIDPMPANSYSKIEVTPNGAYVFAMQIDNGSTGINVKRYTSDGQGGLISSVSNEQFISGGGTKMTFATNSRVAYIRNSTYVAQRKIGSTELEPIGGGNCVITDLDNTLMSLPGYLLLAKPALMKVASVPEDGDLCSQGGNVFVNAPTNPLASFNNAAALHPSGFLYQVQSDPISSALTLFAYKADSAGRWTASFGNPIALGNGSVSEIILDRDRKYLALLRQTNLRLEVVRLNPDGSLSGVTGGNDLSTAALSGTFDARSKAFYLRENNALKGWSISELGGLTPLTLTADPSPEDSFTGLDNVPLF